MKKRIKRLVHQDLSPIKALPAKKQALKILVMNLNYKRMRLDQLRPGESGLIEGPDVQTPTALRLLEMGMTQGTRVYVVRVGAGGKLIQFRVRGIHMVLRRGDASGFWVCAA